jgi:hypothetical protein
MMAKILYELIGGLFAVTVVGWLIGLALKSKDPTTGVVHSTALAWALCSLAAILFVYARTGQVRADLAMIFFPGAILAAFYLRSRYANADAQVKP